jgi:ribonuclease D
MNNDLITSIAERTPKSLEELKLLLGMGPVRLKKYGRKVLDIVDKHVNPNYIKTIFDEIDESIEKTVKPKKTKASKTKSSDDALMQNLMKSIETVKINLNNLSDEQQVAAKHILNGFIYNLYLYSTQ